MSKSGSKSLKGLATLSAKLSGSINDSILSALSSGITLNNVQIDSGTIDGTIIGDTTPGPGTFTTLQSGDPAGQGYTVCFFGLSVGDSACWIPTTSTWDIKGKLSVRDVSDLGNLRVSGNTISSTNSNGNITLNANGTGRLIVNSGITQSSTTGSVSFNNPGGTFIVNSGNTVDINTEQKDVSIRAGTSPDQYIITDIPVTTPGSTVEITTNGSTSFQVGDAIKILSSSSNADGYHTITSVIGNKIQFQLPTGIGIPSQVNTGIISYRSDINLIADDFVNIPVDKELRFGGSQSISGNSTGDLFITSNSITIPDNTEIQLGDTSRSIYSDGSSVVIDTDLYKLGAPITSIITPANIQDRGIEFNYDSYTGFFGYDTSKGSFTFLKETTNNNGVISGIPGDFEIGNLIVNGSAVGSLYSIERLSLTGLSVNVSPSNNVNVTFVSITDQYTTVTGVLQAPVYDGFIKIISISKLMTGSVYHLTCPTGRLMDAGSGSTVGKTLVFDCPGQGAHMIWDQEIQAYLIINSGASII
jgi:hypothetical protein